MVEGHFTKRYDAFLCPCPLLKVKYNIYNSVGLQLLVVNYYSYYY